MKNDCDIIIDVIVNGRCLRPAEIPHHVSEIITAALARDVNPEEIIHEGVLYQWFVRP
jgi:hypothetical protein